MTYFKEALFVGKVFHYFPELPSTNTFAKELISKSNPSEGTVVYTDFQSAGRGQIGSKWLSNAGKNLLLSIILRPKFLPIRQQFALNQAVALGIYDFFANVHNVDVKIKWPNDIYVNNRKIGGILIENTLSGSTFQAAVVGIGLNINQKHFGKGAANPTALCLETNEHYELNNLRTQLFKMIESRYIQLRANKLTDLHTQYLQHLYRFDEIAAYEKLDGTIIQAKIIGISPIGELLLLEQNTTQAYGFKEIKFLI